LELIWPEVGITPHKAAALRGERIACLVSPGPMRQFHWCVGQQVMLHGTFYPVDVTLRIVGTMDQNPRPQILFRRDYLEEVLHDRAAVNAFIIKPDSIESVPLVIGELNEAFANSEAEIECESESSFAMSSMTLVRPLFNLLNAISLVGVISFALVATNTASMSVRERRREIALMRSLGFSRSTVLGCLLAEGIAIGFAGGLLGSSMAQAVMRVLPQLTSALGPFGMLTIPLRVVVEAIGLSILVGFLSSILPAAAAVRQDIITAMRAA
jgi:putative ABC transport system permease protein